MAKFLGGNELNLALGKLFEEAVGEIIIVSPYIKLHESYLRILKAKREDPEIVMTIVFGKNEEDFSKSMKEDDFSFFKEFPNIEIRYEKNLHAKYYANEDIAILTSMNLYSYSQDKNIEAGVLTKTSMFSSDESLDSKAWDYFDRVIEQSTLLYKREPRYKKTLLGLSEQYIHSEVLKDELTEFFKSREKFESSNKMDVSEINVENKSPNGYCIRTGVPIPFNFKMPMSEDAHQSWLKYKNGDYKEKYCHFSGEPSNGETTFLKPILRKNWAKSRRR